MTDMPPTVPPGGSYTPPPPPPTDAPPPPAGDDRTVMLVLSYLGLLGLIPLFAKKEDREIQWHAKNGLFLCVAYILIRLIWWGITKALFSTGIGCLAAPVVIAVGCALWVGYLVVIIMAIMKATNGQRMRFPVISDMADK